MFLAAVLAGFAAIAGLSMAMGLLVTRVLVHAWGLGAADERPEIWLAAHRAPWRTDASVIGSIMAGGVVLPALVGTIVVVCLVLRKWRIAAFVVFALTVESASYRATTLVVHRDRPSVPRLEQLPVNASYPSGHTAAAIAVYGGLVLLLTSRRDEPRRSGRWRGRSRSRYPSSSPARACIAGCTIRWTSRAARWSGSPPSSCSCSRAGRPGRPPTRKRELQAAGEAGSP